MADKKDPQNTSVDKSAPSGDDTASPLDADLQTNDTIGSDGSDADKSPNSESGTSADDSIELPEPSRDDDPDTTTSVASDEDRIGSESGDDEDEDHDEIGNDPADAASKADETITVEPLPVTSSELVVHKRGSFFPLVLGCVIAALIGFGAAVALDGIRPGMAGSDFGGRIDAQDQAIADLKTTMPETVDIAPLTAATETNAVAVAELSDRIEGVSGQLVELTERFTQLEKAPISQGVSDSAISAYEAELTRLQDAMRQQREEVEQMVSQAEGMKADAAARTSETLARAALTRILSALDSGDGYAEPLEQLKTTGTEIPPALSAGSEGISTLNDLRSDFPPAARDALAVTRGAGNSSVGDFFKTQLGVRSLAPREGDDPDAVLSRAEAAVAGGDIATALTEIDALPEEAKAELADWKAAAETRLTTLDAANGLMTKLNSN